MQIYYFTFVIMYMCKWKSLSRMKKEVPEELKSIVECQIKWERRELTKSQLIKQKIKTEENNNKIK